MKSNKVWPIHRGKNNLLISEMKEVTLLQILNIKWKIKEHYEELYAHKLDNLDEMVQFLEIYNLLKLM